MSLSDYIREMRKRKDWSQRDLATASGISNAEISRIESGKRKEPSPSVLKAISKALDVSMEEVLEQAGVIEKGKAIVNEVSKKIDSTTVATIQPSGFTTSSSFLSVEDLSEEEIADVKKYILFLKSQRK